MLCKRNCPQRVISTCVIESALRSRTRPALLDSNRTGSDSQSVRLAVSAAERVGLSSARPRRIFVCSRSRRRRSARDGLAAESTAEPLHTHRRGTPQRRDAEAQVKLLLPRPFGGATVIRGSASARLPARLASDDGRCCPGLPARRSTRLARTTTAVSIRKGELRVTPAALSSHT
eukprot:COSAG01_NODE_5320_length_4335_cov_8.874646_2_plen_175_part_00